MKGKWYQTLTTEATELGAFTAKAAMLADLGAASRAVENGSLENPSLLRLKSTIQALPPYEFDWNRSVSLELLAEQQVVKRLGKSPDPRLLYKRWFGEEAPASFAAPSPAVVSQWHNMINEALDELRRPCPETTDRLAKIRREIASLNPLLEQITPSLTRVEDARGQLEMGRQSLLHAVEGHLGH